MKILIALLLTSISASVSAQKLGAWGWMLQTNAVFKNASNSFLGNINMNGQDISNAAYMMPTQYFALDLKGNTNGPISYYRKTGGANISNLVMDVTLGAVSRFSIVGSGSPGDQGYGGIIWNTDHDFAGHPDPTTMELGLSSARHIAAAMGSGSTFSGHFQIGNANNLTTYGGFNNWAFFTIQGTIGQATATNFSGALTFNTGEFQGANYVSHLPGMVAYSQLTNAPGRWKLLFTSELGVVNDTWDPNTAKARKVFEITGGDLTNAIFFKPINYPTNLGTVAIDCSLQRSDQATAVNITFTAPVNFDSMAKQYEEVIQFITNSAAGTITLTAPANARLTGTTTVTRMCDVHWYIKIGLWTNGVVTQWF